MREPRDLIAWNERLETEDSTWRMHMGDIADVVRPIRQEIRGVYKTEGAKRMQRVFDSTGINANTNLAAGLYGSASNPADVWFRIGTADPEFNDWPGAREYLETVSRRTLASFGPSYCNFYSEAMSAYLDIAAFGEAYIYDEALPGNQGFVEKCIPLSEGRFDIGPDGKPNAFFRKWQYTARQAATDFGKDNLSPKLQRAVDQDGGRAKFWFLHAVTQNEMFVEGRIGQNSKKWDSVYIEIDGAREIPQDSNGYDDFPFFVPYWERASGERHARGPGELNLPDLMSLQVMTKSNLNAGERQGSPPWLAADEGNFKAVRLRPNQVTYGGLSQKGEQLLRPAIEGGGVPFSLEMANQLRQSVRDGFYFTLMQTIGRTGMTAQEFMEHNEERMRLMGPYLSNIYCGWLELHVKRRFRQLSRIKGIYPHPPAAMKGRTLQAEFISPLALAQKSAGAAGAIRYIGALTQAAELDPSVVDNFNADNFAKVVADGFAVPSLLNDSQQREQKRAARLQAAQQAHAAQTADVMAGAAQKGASAFANMRQAAQPQAS